MHCFSHIKQYARYFLTDKTAQKLKHNKLKTGKPSTTSPSLVSIKQLKGGSIDLNRLFCRMPTIKDRKVKKKKKEKKRKYRKPT